jgi:hypothetical protein
MRGESPEGPLLICRPLRSLDHVAVTSKVLSQAQVHHLQAVGARLSVWSRYDEPLMKHCSSTPKPTWDMALSMPR